MHRRLPPATEDGAIRVPSRSLSTTTLNLHRNPFKTRACRVYGLIGTWWQQRPSRLWPMLDRSRSEKQAHSLTP